MAKATLIIVPLLSSLAIAGCGGKTKKDVSSASTAEPSGSDHSRTAKRTERATGELREALLHLRRVHFGFDTATLLPEARDALVEAANRLRSRPKVHIYIDGHTDERGTTDYNLGLGDRRARTVADYLIKLGIPAERLHIVSFGKEQPWASGRGEVSNAKNRRAEFRLMRGDAQLVLDDGVLYDDRGAVLHSSAQ